ncbi:MAG TPA: hypothetical protein VIK71_09805 [Flavobacteriales bacterium]
MTNVTEAIKLLGLEEDADQEAVETAWEEKLFALKKEILPLLPVPSLVHKRIQQLAVWCALESPAAPALPAIDIASVHAADDVISFLEQYERQMSALKLHISNAATFRTLQSLLPIAIELQTTYMKKFKHFFSNYAEALPEEAKSREMIDTGRLLTALKNNNLTSEITWEIEKELARINKLPLINP